jgi:hypothetical protein
VALQLTYMLLSVCCVLLLSAVTVFLFCYWFRLVFFNGFVVVFLSVRECGPIFLVLVCVVVLVHVAGAVPLVIIMWGWSECYLVLFLGMYSFHEIVYDCLLVFWRVA